MEGYLKKRVLRIKVSSVAVISGKGVQMTVFWAQLYALRSFVNLLRLVQLRHMNFV
jgi:hypothetical protein